MQHSRYHEISAATPHEVGLAMGRAFGGALGPFLGELPDLPLRLRTYLDDCLSLTRQHFPDIVAEIEGYAAGAGVAPDRMWHMLLEDDIAALPGVKPEKCTSFVTNAARLAGHNEDWNEAAAARLFILRRSLAGRTMLELHYAGTPGGNAVSVNSAGLIQMINSLPAEPVDISIPRIPSNIIARHMASADDVTAALDTVRPLPRMGGYAHTLISAHPDGPLVVAELSQSDMSVQDIAAFPHIHANHYVLEGMTRFNRDGGNRINSSRKRYDTACRNVTAQMTAADAMTLLEDTSGGPKYSLLNRDTIAGAVIDLDDACAWIRLAAEPGKPWLRYDLDFLP